MAQLSLQYRERPAVFLVPRGAFLKKKAVVTRFGMGNRPQAARHLTDTEEDLMFERGVFGDQDTEVLQRTVWWLLSLHFGFRASDESRKLKWGDVELQINAETGNED